MSSNLTFIKLFVVPSKGSRAHREQIISLLIKLLTGSDSSQNAQLTSRTSCCAKHAHSLKKIKPTTTTNKKTNQPKPC